MVAVDELETRGYAMIPSLVGERDGDQLRTPDRGAGRGRCSGAASAKCGQASG
jgi:hypothetical protein